MNEKRKRVAVLGAGRVGSLIAMDLASDPALAVRSFDADPANLEKLAAASPVETRGADLADPAAIRAAVEDADLAVGALPGRLGLAALTAVLEAGKDVVDISFMPEDPRTLDETAREKGACALVDFGVAPGMSNLLVGRAASRLDEVASVAIHVGGLPRDPKPPFRYKAAFSPADVIEEYTRPARLVENGETVVKPALSGVEILAFEGAGELEAFNTDGLRTLIDTVRAPDMVEKTLRYPGHADLMRAFRDTGLFSPDPVGIGNARVRPLEMTSTLLFPLWTYEEGEEDLTVMRVTVEGRKDGKPARFRWDLFDVFDKESGATSMARTTGYPAAAACRLLLERRFRRPGVHPPETLGDAEGILEAVLEHLAARNVVFERRP